MLILYCFFGCWLFCDSLEGNGSDIQFQCFLPNYRNLMLFHENFCICSYDVGALYNYVYNLKVALQ
jgi:hypothetical protein